MQKFLEVVTTESNEQYVNVDLKTPQGVSRAIELDFVGNKLAGVISSSRIHLTSEVFHPPYRGKCFTFLRHPIDRAISLFYTLKDSPWEGSFKDEFSKMSLEDYTFSAYAESNWLTRMLTNKMTGPITMDDLEDAKTFLKTKCLIGLTSKFNESHDRVEKYFGWNSNSEADMTCEKELLDMSTKGPNPQRALEEETVSKVVLDQLYKLNQFDIRLYEYAIELYNKQAKLFVFV